MRKHHHVTKANKYARDIVAGKIPACKWTIAACQRHLDDLRRSRIDKKYEYYFCSETAERRCRFIELMPHVKGRWAGSTITLQPWQTFIICCVFGWLRKKNKKRRFRIAYIEVARKNAKSTMTSAVGLSCLAIDDESGAEIYSAATTRDQARIVFKDAQEMARRSPQFRQRFGVAVNAHNINVLATASKFEALSAEGSTLDGLNIHFASVDELHAHKRRDVWDVLHSATGARDQSLIWAITTAGSNRAGICYEQHMYVKDILSGKLENDAIFGIIFSIDDGDDWTDPLVWQKANPNLGVSIYEDELAGQCLEAQQVASKQNNFLTKRLNVWVNADTAWMSMPHWQRLADQSLSLYDFEGEDCIAGLDLASKKDVAALVLIFRRQIDGKDHYYKFPWYWLPEDAIHVSSNSQYGGWCETESWWGGEQILIKTPGYIIDFAWIEESLLGIASRFNVIEVAYDPFQATQLATRMTDQGLTMVEMRHTVANLSEPMKELEALVLDERLHHPGCPATEWMISNVVAHLDVKDNIYPRKERQENKIDGPVATIMALGRWMAHRQDESPYEHRGLLVI